jgi:hypothetical protein
MTLDIAVGNSDVDGNNDGTMDDAGGDVAERLGDEVKRGSGLMDDGLDVREGTIGAAVSGKLIWNRSDHILLMIWSSSLYNCITKVSS